MAPNNPSGLYMPQTYSFLSPETFETLVEGYINQLHIRKRNKALITQQLANDCLMVLTNPENTAIFNPKFRWWVRKHFVFTVVGELRILLDKKNGKPVCVREQLYDKVCYFHHIIGHGGRDKTFAAITKSYSKVPAELVSLFTKNCQTCLGVRKYSKNKRPILNENEYPQHHPHQQPQQQQQQHQLTCDTGNFSTSSSALSSAVPQYHSQQQQQYHGMISKSEQGTMTPISPMMHSSNSGFFGSSSQQQQQLDSTYSQLQHHQQMQHMQSAIQAHHMSISLGLSEMSLGNSHVSSLAGLTGLGQLNTTSHQHLHSSMSALSSTCSTPTTMAKMDLPSSMHSYDPNNMASALLPLSHHLTQHNQFGSPSDFDDNHHSQYDQDQLDAMNVAALSNAQYSPLLEQHYQNTNQYQQHAFQNNDYATSAYISDHQQQQLQSTYSAAMSLTSMPLMQQQHNQHPYEQQQQSHVEYQQQDASPLLTQNQMFQKQIQQEQQRFHQQQQQLSVSTSFSTMSGSGSSVSLSSPPPSAVPSLSCSITTPTTAMSPAPLLASITHQNAFATASGHLHPAHALASLLDHEQKNHHLSAAVAELVAGAHDL